MSAGETGMPNRLGTAGPARTLVDAWGENLAQVFESMAGERPEGEGREQELLWWEQPFRGAPEAKAWVATPRSTWEFAGGQTLRAAGLDTVEPAAARNTWLEILSQSLSAMAGAAASALGREVVCAGCGERPPGRFKAPSESSNRRFLGILPKTGPQTKRNSL
jgi:hypothetical protein